MFGVVQDFRIVRCLEYVIISIEILQACVEFLLHAVHIGRSSPWALKPIVTTGDLLLVSRNNDEAPDFGTVSFRRKFCSSLVKTCFIACGAIFRQENTIEQLPNASDQSGHDF